MSTTYLNVYSCETKRYWVMAESDSPKFVIASSSLSTAPGLIRVISLLMNLFLALQCMLEGNWKHITDKSLY
ncbi:hypothetical protein Hanom_Chr01g00020551 [Helianthus anomalus]